MQKTGCTHIASLLTNLFDGEQIGKHNAASSVQINSNSYFISSIRNPWDWYLSLWTYGVQGKGGLMERLTNKNYRTVVTRALRNPIKDSTILQDLRDEITKDVSLWRDVYGESDNVESFRNWLKQIHDPRNSRWLGEGFGRSTISEFCGFMSFRYLYLCCSNPPDSNFSRLISNYTDLVQFDKKFSYIDFFIRQECLEEDFCKAIGKIRTLNNEEKTQIFSGKKTNSSKRPLSVIDYYDRESIDLIYNRDRLIIEKFEYSPPNI